jgi:hypothetical protein
MNSSIVRITKLLMKEAMDCRVNTATPPYCRPISSTLILVNTLINNVYCLL